MLDYLSHQKYSLPPSHYLSGKLLVAMPHMEDHNFALSVIYVCSHDEQGAFGLVINKPLPHLTFNNLLHQLHLKPSIFPREQTVYFGGPVEISRGFVLHSDEFFLEGSIHLKEGFALSASLEVLERISMGEGPHYSTVILGYTGWGSGQLEQEINHNGWICVKPTFELVFHKDSSQIWTLALQSIGVDPTLLVPEQGNA